MTWLSQVEASQVTPPGEPQEAHRLPADAAPESAVLQAASTEHRSSSPPRPRLWAVCDPLRDYWSEFMAPGVVSALESSAGRDAPVGALLLTDTDGGEHGLVVAERTLVGWVIREGASL